MIQIQEGLPLEGPLSFQELFLLQVLGTFKDNRPTDVSEVPIF